MGELKPKLDIPSIRHSNLSSQKTPGIRPSVNSITEKQSEFSEIGGGDQLFVEANNMYDVAIVEVSDDNLHKLKKVKP